MSAAPALKDCGQGCWQLQGGLTFATVPGYWQQLRPLLQKDVPVQISLSQVSECDSAALALLLEARQIAKESGCALSITGIPDDLLALSKLSNCAHLL